MANQSDSGLNILDGLEDKDTVWVENMLDSLSVYRSQEKGRFDMEAHGYVGSVISMPVSVIKETTYLSKAALRGKIRFLSDKDKVARERELEFRDEAENQRNTMLDDLSAGASERISHYAKDLPDQAEESGRSIRPEEIWGATGEPVAATTPGTVKRSTKKAKGTPIEGTDAVLTDPVGEGDWESQTR